MKRISVYSIVTVFALSLCIHAQTLSAAEQVTLGVAHTFAVDHPYSAACEMLSKEVAEKTKGQVAIRHYPAGQLGKDNELTDQLIKGTIDPMPADLIYYTYLDENGRPRVDPGDGQVQLISINI